MLGLDGFPMAFQHFEEVMKADIMAFMREFHLRGMISKNLDASFIVVLHKKTRAERLKDFRPI